MVALIGQGTAGRKWIEYEILEAWNAGLGLVGIKIHNLTDHEDNQCDEGKNPFDDFSVNGKALSYIVNTYNPGFSLSKNVRNYIAENLEGWIEEAIKIRAKY